MPRWVHPAWKVLGIEPTSDTRAIRVAYAAKLKAIDPEADPQAFVMLREAFDAAQTQAQWVDQPEDETPESPSDAPPFASPASPASPAAPSDDRWTSEPATPEAHAKALSALLHAQDPHGPRATDAQSEAMLAHWRAIIADPRMGEVAFFADAEHWFAEQIARASTFSDPLVIPAVEYFGWLDSDGTVHQARVIAYLTYRYRALDFLRSIQQPGNEHYEAWCELTTPAGPGAMRGRVLVRKIHRLLTTVRTAYPDLEDRFDPRRLDLWDPRRTAPPPDATPRPLQKPDKDHTPRNILIAIVVVVFLANLLQLFAPHPPRTAPVTPSIYSMPLVRAEPDIDRAIRARFGNDAPAYATILKRNPKLAKALSDLWASEKVDGASQGDFATEVEPLLNNWYWYGVRNGGLALVTDYQRLTLDMAKALRERSASECNRYLESSHRWTPFLGLPQSFGDRDTRLMFRTLLETDGSNRSEDLTAMVPGEIVDALPKRSGAPKALIDRWFKSRNIGVQECDVTIAYMELVLARARPESLAMLRGM